MFCYSIYKNGNFAISKVIAKIGCGNALFMFFLAQILSDGIKLFYE